MKNKLISIKNHLHAKRARYAVGATLAGCAYVMVLSSRQWHQFLKEEGVYDALFSTEEI